MNTKALRNGVEEVDFNVKHPDVVANGKDAAAICGLAASTMNTYRSLDRGPAHYRYNNRIYYFRGDLQSWRANTPAIKRGRKPKLAA